MSERHPVMTDTGCDADPAAPPLPRADRRILLDPADWLRAEASLSADLARAAMALGRLDGALASLLEDDQRAGAGTRLAMAETGEMLWAAGTPLAPEDLGRDLMDVPARVEPETLRLARWAVRRLEGQGDLGDLRHFLALARSDLPSWSGPVVLRPTGVAFDAAAEDFAERLLVMAPAHPLSRAAYGLALWRLSDLSPEGDVVESACWAARSLAEDCGALAFAPLGMAGRTAWTGGGPATERLGRWYQAVGQGAEAARQQVQRLTAWELRARGAVARIKGDNPVRILRAMAAAPVMTTAMVETSAGISRDTAERLLARLVGMGLIREVTGAKRFRLWAALI